MRTTNYIDPIRQSIKVLVQVHNTGKNVNVGPDPDPDHDAEGDAGEKTAEKSMEEMYAYTTFSLSHR